MSCLDAIHAIICKLVPDIKREDMAHLSPALFCPCLACKGVVKVHEKNGTFVAMAEEGSVMYARCADRLCCCSGEDLRSGWMDVVDSKNPRPWIKLTAEKMAEFESKTRQTVLAGKRKRQTKGAPADDSPPSE